MSTESTQETEVKGETQMLNEVTFEMKKQTRDQASRIAQQIKEMESLLADMKSSLEMVPEFGASAMRGVSQRRTGEHMARVAAQMSKSAQVMETLADLTDAANVGTCEEVGA